MIIIIEYKNNIQVVIDNISENDNKKLRLEVLLRLLDKLEPLDDSVLNEHILNLINRLNNLKPEDYRSFKKEFTKIRNYVSKNHKIYAKGELQQTYMAIGISIGIAIGAGMMTFNSAGIGVGIAIGVAIGLSIGTSKEKQEEEKGNIY